MSDRSQLDLRHLPIVATWQDETPATIPPLLTTVYVTRIEASPHVVVQQLVLTERRLAWAK